MFKQSSGLPMWAHIAIGVAIGGIVAGVVLYLLWMLHWRLELNATLRHWMSGSAPAAQFISDNPPSVTAPQAPLVRTPGMVTSNRTDGVCPTGYTVGTMNERAVCVSPGGRVVPMAARAIDSSVER